MSELGDEDSKLVTLARAVRARNGAVEGAAVRDDTGRTYAATPVVLPSLSVSAVQAAVVMAIASGARGLEAAALVTPADKIPEDDRAVVREFGGPAAPLHLLATDGTLRVSVTG
ncbi:MAG TPA: cytidine deaminase [Sporichthyaceae bacterium]|nr:cytidine deaminase [Sporichthyaceae bacterium]